MSDLFFWVNYMVGGLYLGYIKDLLLLKYKKNIWELSIINNDDIGIKKILYRLKNGDIFFIYEIDIDGSY